MRIKRGNVARKRRNKVLKIASGFRGTHSKLFRVANQQVMKALRYGYIGRKRKKREKRFHAALFLQAKYYTPVANETQASLSKDKGKEGLPHENINRKQQGQHGGSHQ